MEISDFKKGLFGYKKRDVFEYISELNRRFDRQQSDSKTEYDRIQGELNKKNEELNLTAARLTEDNSALSAELERERAKTAALSAELEQTRAETSALKAHAEELKSALQKRNSEEESVSNILAEVKLFAENLRAKAVAEDEAVRRENRMRDEAEKAKLAVYAKQVAQVRESVRRALDEMDGKAAELENRISNL